MTEQAVATIQNSYPRKRVVWTDALDRKLIELRWQGMTWADMAVAMGLGRNTVLERGRRLGARRRPVVREVPEDADRPALPAGHPISWGILNAGLKTQLGPFVYESPLGLTGKGTPEQRAARLAAAEAAAAQNDMRMAA